MPVPVMPKLKSPGPARVEQLRVENYRALCSIELKDITPLTILLGPNGSGKSTVFDVFNFLSECFQFAMPGIAAAEPRN
jgi:AAA15 family ATPase/GTPase